MNLDNYSNWLKPAQKIDGVKLLLTKTKNTHINISWMPREGMTLSDKTDEIYVTIEIISDKNNNVQN